MGSAVTRIGGEVFTLEQLLTKHGNKLAGALPRGLNLDAARLAQIAITSVRKTPKLQDCDALSIVACVIQGAQLGLEMDGVLGNAYMVPYAQQAQFIIGYKGWLTLLYRSERVSYVEGKNVYQGDDFQYREGTDKFIHHVPAADIEDGHFHSDNIIHSYVIINLSDGQQIFEVWPRARIEQHRDRFSQGYKANKKDSPWTFAFESMALKTVMRSVVTFAPISTAIHAAAALEGQYEAHIPQNLAVDFDLTPIADPEKPADQPADAPTDSDVVLNRDQEMPTGKYKGKTFRNLPYEYLVWMTQNLKSNPDLLSLAQQELNARPKPGEDDPKAKRAQESAGEESQDEGAPFTEIEQMEITLTEMLQDKAFTDVERVGFGVQSEGGNHDEKWLDNQIQWVKQTIDKRRATGS